MLESGAHRRGTRRMRCHRLSENPALSTALCHENAVAIRVRGCWSLLAAFATRQTQKNRVFVPNPNPNSGRAGLECRTLNPVRAASLKSGKARFSLLEPSQCPVLPAVARPRRLGSHGRRIPKRGSNGDVFVFDLVFFFFFFFTKLNIRQGLVVVLHVIRDSASRGRPGGWSASAPGLGAPRDLAEPGWVGSKMAIFGQLVD